jgi:hypothetical protein
MSEDIEQNRRLRSVEERVNILENSLAGIGAKLEILQGLSKAVLVIAGLALGVDIVPMM